MAPEPRGEFVRIDGRRLHIVRAGPADDHPLVILEAGSFGFSADWAAVQAQLAGAGVRSLAYDRAGMALSDPGPAPRDGLAIVSDLEALLAALGEAGPFVVAGHSMAGLHIHLFAARNAEQIAGLVFVDAITPDLSVDPWVSRGTAFYIQFSRFASMVASLRLMPLAKPWSDQIGLPADARAHKRWAFAHAGHNRVSAAEVIQWDRAAAQAAEAGALNPAWPVAVVLAGAARGPAHLSSIMTGPADRSRRGHVERVTAARHASLIGQRYGGAVTRAILHVRTAYLEQAA